MARPDYFYFQTIKNVITAFGILFRDVVTEDDYGNSLIVPIYYSPKEKFIEMINAHLTHDDGYEVKYSLPRFGFELTNISYDEMRMTNPMAKIHDLDAYGERYMYNRVPYNFNFSLYLATIKFEDSLKIIEQIVPFFTPELNLSINDKEDFGIVTDIPFVLDSVTHTIEFEGAFTDRRTVFWVLTFTAKAWLYSNTREQTRIKETIVTLGNQDFSKIYETLISVVEPREAEKFEDHEIIDTIIEGEPGIIYGSNTAKVGTNNEASVERTSYTTFTGIREIQVGTEIELYTLD